MSFLGRLRLTWRGFSLRGLDRVADGEPIARFLPHQNWFSRANNKAKLPAFMPAPQDNETSVYRILRLTEHRIRKLGQAVVAGRPLATLYGRAELTPADVAAVGLHIRRAKVLPSRHVGVAGWPPPAEKSKVKLIAGLLADAATLKLYQ